MRADAPLLGIEGRNAAALTRDYAVVLAALFEDLDALNVRIAEHDGPVRPAWLYRQERYRSLIESLQLNLAEWLGAAHTQITEAKRESLTVATVDAEDLALAAMGRGPDLESSPSARRSWRCPRRRWTP